MGNELNQKTVAVRYCGGCNPKFDRVAFVKRLEALLPELRFEAITSGQDYSKYDAALIVAGCRTTCVETNDLPLPASRIVAVSSFDALLPARDKLRAMDAGETARELTRDEILQMLPHRPPVLFLDRVTRLVPGAEVTAEFFADPALDFFAGHFPENPVFPGSLLIEAMAQAADVLLLSMEQYHGKTPYLQGLGKANFRRPVLPGSTLELRASLLSDRPEMGASVCRGQVFVGDQPAADAEIILALR